MNQQDLTIAFTVQATPAQAFEAIKNVRGWWSETIEGSADEVGDEFTYQHGELHRSTQVLEESVVARRLVWRVSEARLSFVEDPAEWEGTRLCFDVIPAGDGAEVRFTHVGLGPQRECYEACSKGWRFYAGESLRALIATGRGKPDRKARSAAHASP